MATGLQCLLSFFVQPLTESAENRKNFAILSVQMDEGMSFGVRTVGSCRIDIQMYSN
jgi:hypothetical protein